MEILIYQFGWFEILDQTNHYLGQESLNLNMNYNDMILSIANTGLSSN